MNHLDSWEKHISRQLFRHTATPPADGWNAIERRLRQMEAEGKAPALPPRGHTRRRSTALFVALLSAAACTTLVLLLKHPAAELPSIEQVADSRPAQHGGNGEAPTAKTPAAQESAHPQRATALAGRRASPDKRPTPTASNAPALAASMAETALTANAPTPDTAPTGENDSPMKEEKAPTPSVRRAFASEKARTTATFSSRTKRTAQRESPRRKRALQFALHGNAAPTFGAENDYGQFPNLLVQGGASGSDLGKLSDVTNVMLLDFYANPDQEIDYKIPVQVGLSIGIPLSDRWSLHTGLSYTYLGTDIKKGNTRGYTLTRQKLHYVGIPVQISFDFLETRPVTLYASAGGMVEKCVKGETSATYHRADGYTSSGSTDDRIGRRLWQFSLNAAAGVQFNIVRSVGIYCEPGLTYYVPDGSDLPTIRDAHPWNFSLQTGIRFTLP